MRDRTPPQQLALGEALALLGNAQFGTKNFDAAEKAFTEALQIVEQNAGAASPKLLILCVASVTRWLQADSTARQSRSWNVPC